MLHPAGVDGVRRTPLPSQRAGLTVGADVLASTSTVHRDLHIMRSRQRALHPYGIKDTACRRTRGDGWAMPVGVGPAAPRGLPALGGVYGRGGQGHYGSADAYHDLVPRRLEQCHRPRDAILLRTAAHAVGALIMLQPA